ncbi:MAG: aminopeptidase [Candidatus Aenigmarchaeota archaeon]|nr:aminopeptidase [Candidatus Aenigmarchaeota archaeon]
MKIGETLIKLLGVKPWEKVLVLTDFKKEDIGRKIYEELKDKASVKLFVMKTRSRDGEEPTRRGRELMLESDVIFAITFYSITHTKTVRDCIRKGKRIASMPNLSEFSITNGGLTADYEQIQEITKNLLDLVKDSRKVKVVARNGTNVEFSVEGRKWYKDDGWLNEMGSLGNLPAGEVFVAPIEDSVNGTIVFDSFPLSSSKLVLKVKDGKCYDVKGDSENLEKIFIKLGEKARQIAEFGIGTNPKAKIIGNILEDEKVLGTCHFALGNNVSFGGKNDVSFHLDGIIKDPTIFVDEKEIMRNGVLKLNSKF